VELCESGLISQYAKHTRCRTQGKRPKSHRQHVSRATGSFSGFNYSEITRNRGRCEQIGGKTIRGRHCESTNWIGKRRVDNPHGIENNNNKRITIIILRPQLMGGVYVSWYTVRAADTTAVRVRHRRRVLRAYKNDKTPCEFVVKGFETSKSFNIIIERNVGRRLIACYHNILLQTRYKNMLQRDQTQKTHRA